MHLGIRNLILFAFLLLPPLAAHAEYYTADLPAPGADPAMGTHLIIVGKGMEAGNVWAEAGHTAALVFKDRARHGRIRVIGAIENDRTLRDLADWGYTGVRTYREDMTGDRVVARIKELPLIESIDFIGHNGALLGFALENFSNRFFLNHVNQLAAIKDHFSKDAFIRVMGCNTGWQLAPAFARVLGVPASGTLTSADVQLVYQPGVWLFDERSGGAVRENVNAISFSTPVDCRDSGGCVRLRAINGDYSGMHGNYKGNLPFAKFFCGSVSPADCFRRMAKSLMYLPSSVPLQDHPTLDAFADVMVDQFCPNTTDAATRGSCADAISRHLAGTTRLPPGFTTNPDDSLTCDFNRCQYQLVCDTNPCVIRGTGPHRTATFVNELDAYRAGFESWSHEP